MRYVLGALIISFGIILVGSIIFMALDIKPKGFGFVHFLVAWGLIAICCYPAAKKLVRAE